MENNIKLNLSAAPYSGQIVTFTAPCNCDLVADGLVINGDIYTVCDTLGTCVTGKGGAWIAGAKISVVLDCENKKAYLQGGGSGGDGNLSAVYAQEMAALPEGEGAVYAVAQGNGRLVALYTGGTIGAYSDNGGYTWHRVSLPVADGGWMDIAFGEGVFVAVGYSSTAIFSEDGITWYTRELPASHWRRVAFGNGRFIASGHDLDTETCHMAYSDNGGESWTAVKKPPSFDDDSLLAYGNGKWVAMIEGSVACAVSSDEGETWTTVNVPTEFNTCGALIFTGDVFFALGWSHGAEGKAIYSENGETWVVTNTPSLLNVNSSAFANGTIVAIDYAYSFAAWSDDLGKTWTQAELTDDETVGWQNVRYIGDRFIAITRDGKTISFSETGEAWGKKLIQKITSVEVNGVDETAQLAELLAPYASGKEGPPGESGVYIGSGPPPHWARVWINPEENPTTTESWEFDMDDGTTEVKTVVVL